MAQPPELASKTQALLQKGREQGYLDQEEILLLFPDMGLGDKRVARFYDLLLKEGIRVMDALDTEEDEIETDTEVIPEIEVEPQLGLDQTELDEETEIPEDEPPDAQIIIPIEVTSDPVRMYLREIGQVDLLEPDEEMRLAVQMSAPHYLVKVLTRWLAQRAGLS